MPRVCIPRYRHYKPKNLGMVVIRGKAHYLGKYGTEESLEEYRRLIAEFLRTPASETSSGTSPATIEVSGPTINELLVAYWERFVVTHYVKDGRPTSEQDNIKQALRFLRRLHGHTAAGDFGPKALVLVREAMIQSGRCRRLVNNDVNRVRALSDWAVEQELFPGRPIKLSGRSRAWRRDAATPRNDLPWGRSPKRRCEPPCPSCPLRSPPSSSCNY